MDKNNGNFAMSKDKSVGVKVGILASTQIK